MFLVNEQGRCAGNGTLFFVSGTAERKGWGRGKGGEGVGEMLKNRLWTIVNLIGVWANINFARARPYRFMYEKAGCVYCCFFIQAGRWRLVATNVFVLFRPALFSSSGGSPSFPRFSLCRLVSFLVVRPSFLLLALGLSYPNRLLSFNITIRLKYVVVP